jgi:hypothetical protein
MAVSRLRLLRPNARIVHELNVNTGQCRVDIAAVDVDWLGFVEVKSRKDKLDRLQEQVRVFAPACHRLAVIYASERWSYDVMRQHVDYGCDLWPEDRPAWHTFGTRHEPPNTAVMLNLLWAEELRDEARRAGFQPSKKASRSPLMHMLWEGLTGREVVAAVCRQLRARPFAEADPAVTP